MLRVDSHQHFWERSRGDYHWLESGNPALEPLRADFLPADLAAELNEYHIGQSVVVQAAETQSETCFLLECAERTPCVTGVVGWVDMANLQSLDFLEKLAGNSYFKGIRPMLQDLEDPNWIVHRPQPEVIAALIRQGLRFDALVTPRHLAALYEFVRSNEALAVVIDHAAKPSLDLEESDSSHHYWLQQMQRLAQFPRVYCKFSGLFTQMSSTLTPEKKLQKLRQTLHVLLEIFGSTRIMWGSDWPVVNLAGDYRQWVEASRTCLNVLSEDEQEQIWGRTAIEFYGLEQFPRSNDSI